tara:strand:- start:23 stop:1459 length:1437 start_codon:yes stop_codon:yes gene_type:complete
MATKFSSSTDFSMRSFKIFPQGAAKAREVKDLVVDFEYVESVISPCLTAAATIVDSAGMITSLPIRGGERVVVEVLTNTNESGFRYEMVIWKVANRFAQQKQQTYTIGLISAEALQNEVTRVDTLMEGNPQAIIKKVLKDPEYIGTPKNFFSEPSLLEVRTIPPKMRPFDLAAQLASKSVSPKATFESTNSSNTNKTAQEIKGSGGFLFWETYRGYNFFAVDSICADDNSPLKSDSFDVKAWGEKKGEEYTERLGNIEDGADDRFTIKKSLFATEVDMMHSLRRGKYSSLLVFFNHSTGQYEEYVYKIKDSYANMATLGGQEGISLLPVRDKELSDYPTRVMSIYLDHESWSNSVEPASPEPGDKSKKPTPFADWQKYYTAQSLARYRLMQNQQCTIVIPGNAEICAGDRINVKLISKLPDEDRKEKTYDQESSGLYLIKELTHTYDTSIGSNGRFLTTLRLMRDSYGEKGKVSAHSK